jgi:glycosyltransferase involved in cell wall biosynthesis
MISIIIPAHNEESVIARGLRALLTGAAPGELEVVVACNGCTDRTAEVARSFGSPVRVLEVAQASKIAALNAADAVAVGFPRFYIDADVIIELASVRRIAFALEKGSALMATPQVCMPLRDTTWPVRAFYRVWTALAYNRTFGAVGTGVYAVSAAGRARWRAFPDVISDDGFVRFCFATHERSTVEGAVSHVDPPRDFARLIRIKTRSRLGLYQLRASFPGRSTSDRRRAPGAARHLLGNISLWPQLPIYLLVNLVTRVRAARQFRSREQLPWERDESARAVLSALPQPDLNSGGAGDGR